MKLGYYSYCIVETSNVGNAAFIGGLAGGLVGGLIVAGIASSLSSDPKNDVVLVIDHQTGAIDIADYENIHLLVSDEFDYAQIFGERSKEVVDNRSIVSAINEFNSRKKEDLKFDFIEYGPLITVVRETRKQSENAIDLYVNDQHIKSLTNSNYFKDRIPFSPKLEIEFRIGNSIKSEKFVYEIAPKERLYFIISNSHKSKEIIDVKESDATRTKYKIDEFR